MWCFWTRLVYWWVVNGDKNRYSESLNFKGSPGRCTKNNFRRTPLGLTITQHRAWLWAWTGQTMIWAMQGDSLKLVTVMLSHIDLFFFVCLFVCLFVCFFFVCFFLTRSHRMTPFFINSQTNFRQSLTEWPAFLTTFHQNFHFFFEIVVNNVSNFVFSPKN